MRERRFKRTRHQSVAAALRAMDAAFLAEAQCYFAGGTRIVLELGEYRESEDLDFLCASRGGYRALRSTVTDRSLGRILASPLPLAREVRADRYGIRTFFDMGETKLKMEIVNEARIDLAGQAVAGIPVPCLDHVSCFAEKYLANADGGNDDSARSRDIIDLAFMIEAWGEETAAKGAAIARESYGMVVDQAAVAAATRLVEDKAHLRQCVTGLRVTDEDALLRGLRRLAKRGPATRRAARKRAKT